MEKSFFQPDKGKCNELAKEYFMKSSGLICEKDKIKRLHKSAMEVYELIQEQVSCKGQFAYYSKASGEMALRGEILQIGDTMLVCKAFEKISPETVEGVYFYVCTAGKCMLQEKNLLTQVYADLWGNAYTDAIRELMRQLLSMAGPLSDSFGPGFYGMHLSEIKKLAEFLDFDQAGVSVKESMTLYPDKSCAGIYFRVNAGYTKLAEQCAACRGNCTSCRLCRYYEKQ